MTYTYFKGYFDDLKALLREKERLLELKDRSICPHCRSGINRNEVYQDLDKNEAKLEALEIKKRKYNNNENNRRLSL